MADQTKKDKDQSGIAESPVSEVFEGRHPAESEKRWAETTLARTLEKVSIKRTFCARWLAVCGLFLAVAPLLQGQARNMRQAMGDEPASEMEAVFTAFLPGATVEWEPKLALRVGDNELIPIDSSEFKCMPQLDGSFRGFAAFELGTAKREYLEKLLKFEPLKAKTFPTTLVVFRMDSSHKVTELRKFDLEPSGLSKIEILDLRMWPAKPTDELEPLLIEYGSYIVGDDFVAEIEWYSAFDTRTGSFVWRKPSGVDVKFKNGKSEMLDIIQFHSQSADHVEFRGTYTGVVVRYACSDPCIVDGKRFFDQWLPLAETSTGSPELQKIRDVNDQIMREQGHPPPEPEKK